MTSEGLIELDLDENEELTIIPLEIDEELVRKPWYFKILGLFYMALSAFTFSLMSLAIHFLSTRNAFPAWQLISIRGMIGAVIAFIYLKRSKLKESIFGPLEFRKLLLLRAFVRIFSFLIIIYHKKLTILSRLEF